MTTFWIGEVSMIVGVSGNASLLMIGFATTQLNLAKANLQVQHHTASSHELDMTWSSMLTRTAKVKSNGESRTLHVSRPKISAVDSKRSIPAWARMPEINT